MTAADTGLRLRACRLARRLGRLFRIECAGGFDRRPAATVWRIIERRKALIEELARLQTSPGLPALSRPPEPENALRELARDVDRAANRMHCKMAQIEEDLRARREGLSTEIRGSTSGRLLGQS
jgi:hypothetical protein